MKLRQEAEGRWLILVDHGGAKPATVGRVIKTSRGWLAECMNQQVQREHRSMTKAALRLVAALAAERVGVV